MMCTFCYGGCGDYGCHFIDAESERVDVKYSALDGAINDYFLEKGTHFIAFRDIPEKDWAMILEKAKIHAANFKAS